MVAVGVSADRQNDVDLRHEREQAVVPSRCAFAARRQVSARSVVAGKAEAHRRNANAARIVEGLPVHLQPGPQAVAGRVVERQAGLVDPKAGRLAGDQKARRRRHPQDRARIVR